MQIVTCAATMANKEILIFAQLFFVAAVGGALIQSPLNVATSVGSQTIFNCSSDTTGAITWLYTTNCNTAGGSTLTDSSCNIISSYSSHYRTEKPGGFVCNLIVFNASLSLGGCYACADGFGTGRLFQAMLIVVDSNANITTNSTDIIPGEDVVISSSVSYRGPSLPQQSPPLPPSFYWTLQSDPSQNITSYQELTTNTTALSYIIVTVQPPNVPPYLCNLFFHAPAVVPASCADNAPTYSRSWTTPTYTVSYPPQNVTISVTPNTCLHESANLTCSASGYPTPTYKWFSLTSGVVLPGSNPITIYSDGSYQCVAKNTIRNVPYSASTTASVSDCAVYTSVNLGISYPACISLLVIVIFFGLNLLCFTVFILCYGCSENGRNTLNDRFPWLKKMLPCMNHEGCKCSVWIFYFVILSILAAFVFFPTILIMASCCKKKKTSQGYRQLNERYRYERGGRGTQVKTLRTAPSQYPSRMSVTSNPPSSLNTSANFQLDPTDRLYPHSSTQQHLPTYWGSSDLYPQLPMPLPRKSPSPALSTGGVVYAQLGVDNQPKSRRTIQPIQNDANTHADIAIA